MTVVSRFLMSASLLLAPASSFAVSEDEVVTHYTDLAHAIFQDALVSARVLQTQVMQLTAQPSEQTLEQARLAWIDARVPYQQSEVFRFGNPVVDDWEGQLNAWPLDEGLIDYVDTSSYHAELGNPGASANLIANTSLRLGSEVIDTQTLTPELLASLNELAGSEANVATGYHAIEFLLWGQDLNGTQPGAGERAHTDYAKGEACTNGHCERRAAYLQAITELLISDLDEMVQQWAPEQTDNYRAQLLALDSQDAMTRMLFGMGSLALGELAGERLKVALEANSPEDEHDCFSDNTHYSHYYDGLGIRNIYLGEYQRIDGTSISGPSLSDLVAAKNSMLDHDVRKSLDHTQAKLRVLVDSAEREEQPQKFDQLIGEDNRAGHQVIENAIEALVLETEQLENAARALGINNLNPDTAEHDF